MYNVKVCELGHLGGGSSVTAIAIVRPPPGGLIGAATVVDNRRIGGPELS
jgi:hypothetical protein